MEKTADLCWRQVWRSQIHSSWEEKVFAEDASGLLGGCVWPPRSYFCSFCTREFRSAQALGGHMNVHRRDRARLKQSLSASNGETKTLDEITPSSVTPAWVSADLSSKENFAEHNLVGEDKKSTLSWGDHLGFSVEKSRKEAYRSLHFGHYDEKIVGQSKSTWSCGNGAISCKRLKMADDLNMNCNSTEDLDLELRLGDPPASLSQAT